MAKLTVRLATEKYSIEQPTSRYLWQLCGIDRKFKLDTFLSGGLYLSRLDTFTGFPEGRLTRRNLGLLNKLPEHEKAYIRAQYKRAVRHSFASCWHMSQKDPSDFAWEQFGDYGNGIAIRTSPSRIAEAIERLVKRGAAHFGKVRYVSHRSGTTDPRNILYRHLAVRTEYKKEREARVLIHTYGPIGMSLVRFSGPRGPLARLRKTRAAPPTHEAVGGFNRGLAIVLGIDPKHFIEEIVIGPMVRPSISRDLAKQIADAGLTCLRES